MKRDLQWFARWVRTSLALVIGCVASSGCLAAAEPPTPPPMPSAAPLPPSPFPFFRDLLAANTEQLGQLLADRPAAQREILLAKVREYQGLSPTAREHRLKATELQWYFRPLLGLPMAARQERVAQIPEPYRDLVVQRLTLWDALSPEEQQDMREYQTAVAWFIRSESQGPDETEQDRARLSPARQQRLALQLNQWQALPPERRRRMCLHFEHFFELSPRQKEKTLEKLTPTTREGLQATLKAFENLPPDQRERCLESFRKFARLSAEERTQFLRTAEHWRRLSPEERELWRSIATRRPAIPPPLPPPATRAGRIPPSPPSLASNVVR